MNKLMRKRKIDFEIDETSMDLFYNNIEEIRKHNDTYIESITEYCKQHDIDVIDVLPLISLGLKQKIAAEELKLGNLVEDFTSTDDLYE